MTIAATRHPRHDELLIATIRYGSGLFQFLSGLLPEQVEWLRDQDEETVRRIADSKNAVLIPSLRSA